jgi:nitrogen regulatory protein P-II 1
MKKIEIIVPDRLFNDVNRIVKDVHVGGMTFYKVEGRGKIKAKPVAIARGTQQFTPEFIPRIKMEVVVNDDQVGGIVNKIANELANPAVGGKIFVVDVARAVDLATKERLSNQEGIPFERPLIS